MKGIKALEKIAPNWTRRLKDTKFDPEKYNDSKRVNKHVLNMGSFGCCIVGEAHGFDSRYSCSLTREYCDICTEFAIELVSHPEQIEAFVTHFKEAHQKR